MNRKLLGLTAVAALALTACGTSSAASNSEFPVEGKTIELVVPSAAGAGNDILARIIAPSLETGLGANVEVINKEGGGQIIGLSYIAEAEANGMTMGFTNIPSVLGRYLDPPRRTRSSIAPASRRSGPSPPTPSVFSSRPTASSRPSTICLPPPRLIPARSPPGPTPEPVTTTSTC